MKSTFVGTAVFLMMILTNSKIASANTDPACSALGGPVIFKNTLYGVLTGGVVTGLIALAAESESAGQNIAVGGAVGASLGLGYGVFEATSRKCNSPSQNTKKVEMDMSCVTPYFNGKSFGLNWQMTI